MKFRCALRCVLLSLVLGCGNDTAVDSPPDLYSTRAILRHASHFDFPMAPDSVDCNSPAHWVGDTFFIFNSFMNVRRSQGTDLFNLTATTTSRFNRATNGSRWIESTWKDTNGVLYAWYHNEPFGICPGSVLTVPRIGAAVSFDNGVTFRNLGYIIETRDTINCAAENGFDAGGNGDFSVLPDSAREYLYFFFSVFAGDVSEQGVAVARMSYADRDNPVGKVWKWHGGEWKEPGQGGLATPIFPAYVDWARYDADAFWGPSIHWNTHLNRYVILLNRAKGPPGYLQEGIYVTFNPDISDPTGWSQPVRIHEGGWWYPQIIGIDASQRETDKLAGRTARFFMEGISDWEILFLNPGELP